MKYRMFIAFIIALSSSKLVVAASPCQNTPDGNIAVINGQITCKLLVNGPLPSSEGILSKLIQRVIVEADINYSVLDVLSQLAAHPDRLTLPQAQTMLIKLLIYNKELPINMTVQPLYRFKNGKVSLCDLEIIGFEPKVTKLTSRFLPSWLARGLQNYINRDPQIKKEAILKAQRVLPQIKSHLQCP
ncbi:MAG: hypothetical protein ABFS56_15725 [Pseudomonadota bacterium]